MKSRWYESKEKAINLRKRGASIKDVETRLGIPRSTLSGWFKDIKLAPVYKKRLNIRWKKALIKARVGAVKWHNQEKEKREDHAKKEALLTMHKFDSADLAGHEIALAMLYMGEGFKTGSRTGMGNSDPLILKVFISLLVKIYSYDISKIRCDLHLRADQNDIQMKQYWSKELKIPFENFTATSFDQRTKGRKTYTDYKGVCLVRCGTVAIQRKLLYLSKAYCESVIKMHP